MCSSQSSTGQSRSGLRGCRGSAQRRLRNPLETSPPLSTVFKNLHKTFPHPLCYKDLTKIDLPIGSTQRLKKKSPIPFSHKNSAIEKCKSKLQWGITSLRSEWPPSKNLQTVTAREGVEKREPSCTVGGNVNWYNHYGEQYGGSLRS